MLEAKNVAESKMLELWMFAVANVRRRHRSSDAHREAGSRHLELTRNETISIAITGYKKAFTRYRTGWHASTGAAMYIPPYYSGLVAKTQD